MSDRRVPAAAAVFAAMLGGGLAQAPALADGQLAGVAPKRVTVMDNFFEPRSITIQRGDKVVWIWKGDNAHNIVFTKVPKGAGRRGADARRQGRWGRRFGKRGYYKYVCTIHAGQRGVIEVTRPEPPQS
jgi:plastocyanin